MADDFALGAALSTAGQGLGHMSDTMFAAQIQAANNAQRADLEHQRMQFDQEKAAAQEKETARAHDLEHSDRQSSQEESARYHDIEANLRGKEVDYTGQRTAAEVANMADETRHRGVQEAQENEKIGIERDKANNESGKGAGAADKAAETIAQHDLTQAQEAVKKVNPDNIDPSKMTDDQHKAFMTAMRTQNEAQAKLDAIRGRLIHAGKLNMAPYGSGDQGVAGVDPDLMKAMPTNGVAPKENPKASPKPAAAAAPKFPMDAAGNPGAVIRDKSGNQFQSVNGQWVPYNG